MKITFLGATHEVTGSCTMLSAGGHNILIDCGMEQGRNIFENQELPVSPSQIDCIVLTHAHIDHSGKIPLMFKNGFSGSVYATDATCRLASIMLLDSAHIQELESEWKSRKAKRAGDAPYEPLYTTEDAQTAINHLVPFAYNEERQILENFTVSFTDVGHLLGSAAVTVTVTEGNSTKSIVFSGDIGNINQPILCDPCNVRKADYLVIESTYGNRTHPERIDYISELSAIIQSTFDRGGNVVIPSFAVGRTQELLYFIRQIKEEGLIKGHNNFPVYVDSPLANEATSIFLQTSNDYFDEETKNLLSRGINPIWFEGLSTAQTGDESKAINFDTRPKIIISASGMCEAGRIRHHLKHNLWKPEATVLFVGYQANGTLGRSLVDGAREVTLFGESISVKAKIKVLAGVSGHADKIGLLNWINAIENKPTKVFVNHGDDDSCTAFCETLKNEYGYDAYAPFSGTVFDMASASFSYEAIGVQIEKINTEMPKRRRVYDLLIAAAERLTQTAHRFDGCSNKDTQRFCDQINELNNKWSHWRNS